MATPASSRRKTIRALIRVITSSLLITLLFAGCLYLYHTAFSFYHAQLLETEKKTTAFFVEQLSFSLPFLVIGLFFAIVYRPCDRRDGVASREKMWISVLVTLLVYGAMLPCLNLVSREMYEAAVAAGADIPKTDGGVPKTLMMGLLEWFLRLTIPMGLLILFYGMRSSRERRDPTPEQDEQLPTVEEYNARLCPDGEAVLTETAPADGDGSPEKEVAHG